MPDPLIIRGSPYLDVPEIPRKSSQDGHSGSTVHPVDRMDESAPDLAKEEVERLRIELCNERKSQLMAELELNALEQPDMMISQLADVEAGVHRSPRLENTTHDASEQHLQNQLLDLKAQLTIAEERAAAAAAATAQINQLTTWRRKDPRTSSTRRT